MPDRTAADNEALWGNATAPFNLSPEARELIHRVAYQPSSRPEPIRRLAQFVALLEARLTETGER